MQLKTYRGTSMAHALAEVKKDLGADAVILHTRTFKVGGVLGVGAKGMVEITASADPRALRPKRVSPSARAGEAPAVPARAPSGAGAAMREPAPVRVPRAPRPTRELSDREAQRVAIAPPRAAEPESIGVAREPGVRAGVMSPARLPEFHISVPSESAVSLPALPASRPMPPEVLRVEARPAAPHGARVGLAIEEELASIKRLVGQVLQSTRRSEARSGEVPIAPACAPLASLCARLLDSGAGATIVDMLASAVRGELTAEEQFDARSVERSMLRQIARRVRTVASATPPTRDSVTGRPAVVALIGPTGVGKTTTIAKLAALYKLRHGRRVGLVTADTYRIAAVEQLRTYAEIVGLPLRVALAPEDMSSALAELGDCDVVLVDTAGRAPRDAARLGELARFLDEVGAVARHLTLSLASSESAIRGAVERFAMLAPDRLLFTKLDEAVEMGVLLNILEGVALPLSYVTTGQEVPDHIDPASPERIARVVLGVDAPLAGTSA